MSDVLVFMNSSYQLRLSATQDVNKRTDDIYFESAAEIYLNFFLLRFFLRHWKKS